MKILQTIKKKLFILPLICTVVFFLNHCGDDNGAPPQDPPPPPLNECQPGEECPPKKDPPGHKPSNPISLDFLPYSSSLEGAIERFYEYTITADDLAEGDNLVLGLNGFDPGGHVKVSQETNSYRSNL